MRILIATPSVPYPLIWGFGIRVYEMIKFLAARHDVSVVAYAAEYDAENEAAVRQTGARIYPVLQKEGTTSRKRSAQLASILAPASYQRRSLTSPDMQATLDRVLSEDFDVIQVESSQMTGFHFRSNAALVVDEHNIEYELLHRTYRTERSLARKFFNWIEYRKFRREEQHAWRQSDGCILTSDREERILQRVASHTPTLVVPNGIDTDRFRPSDTRRDPDMVVFVGVMHYRPNVDAVLFFAQEILPRLLSVRPNLRFVVVGGGPPEEVRRLASRHIEITDTVPDTRPYLARAGAVVVPLRMGSGTRLKVLEGLAMGAPLVATTLGCEGIRVQHDKHLLVADEPQAFAEQLLRAVDNPEVCRRLGLGGRELVERRYSWSTLLPDLDLFLQTSSARKRAGAKRGTWTPSAAPLAQER